MRNWVRWSILVAMLGGASVALAQRDVEEYGGAGGDDVALSGRARSTRGSTGGLRMSGGARFVPDAHTVRRGDTLWDITGFYYGNPWEWPRVWSYNPEITNPHW
ncbi:MAG: LysM peptidoglycan-binding domain-containing protein, partial [Polyangiaceae bacterium]|nr:LysM peptidoglycan-binding domain-containing protein [Polyangiaceae bacterium]